MIWFIKYLFAVTMIYNYWGMFTDWTIEKWYRPRDYWYWFFALMIIMIVGVIITIKVYR